MLCNPQLKPNLPLRLAEPSSQLRGKRILSVVYST